MTLVTEARKFQDWLDQLKQVTADKLGIEPSEVRINSDAAYEWYKSGFTPAQTFRETWNNENDTE